MTNQTSPAPGAPRPPRRKPTFWLRATPWQRAGVVAAALILPCCGGAAVIGTLTGGKPPVVATAPAGVTPAAERLAAAPTSHTTTSSHRTTSSPGKSRTTPSRTTPSRTTPSRTTPSRTTPSRTTPPPTTPSSVVKRITTRTSVAYPTRRVPDSTLAKGVTRVRTRGVTGVRTRTYEIVLRGGREISRKLVRSVVTTRPITRVVAVGTRAEPATGRCDPNYTPCVPIASDVDCAGGSGDGPAYVTGPVQVIGDDIYDLDRDGDGTACDT